MDAWKQAVKGLLDVFGDNLATFHENSIDDDSEHWLEQLVLRIDASKLRKALEAFGAGLLNERSRQYRSKGLNEELLYRAGQMLYVRIKALQQNRARRLQQAEKIAQLREVKELKQLRALEPQAFEYWTGGYFEQFGFRNVTVTTLSADFGVDVHMTSPNGKRAVVQCKRYNGQVGRPVVQQTYGIMKLLDAKLCYVVTTGRFTKQAHELGERRDIILLDGPFLASGKRPFGSRRSYRKTTGK
jgi:HJR/Mrr/RecB family endonuclease